jgi:hypothetical protein
MINGIFVKSTKEILYSRYIHDCRFSQDLKCSIDGGFDYTKITGNFDDYIEVKIDEGVLLKQILQYDYLLGNKNSKEYPNGYHGRYIIEDNSNLNFFKKLIINFEDIREWL